jgi:hypothetical protein
MKQKMTFPLSTMIFILTTLDLSVAGLSEIAIGRQVQLMGRIYFESASKVNNFRHKIWLLLKNWTLDDVCWGDVQLHVAKNGVGGI